MNGKDVITCVIDEIFPRFCHVCNRRLSFQEPYICISCMDDIPLTRQHEKDFNDVEQLLAGKARIEKASSLFYYIKGSKYANILHDVKYRNQPKVARWLARRLSNELYENGYFEGIDIIVPVPLHITKKADRGYNQSEFIAHGFSDTAHIPVINALLAKKAHATQTHKGIYERWENIQDTFKVKSPDIIEGKHILLVDDVITTGATILSAANELLKIEGVKVSVLSMALAKD